MKYREIIIGNPDYLHLRCRGRRDRAAARRSWQGIAAALTELKHGRVLIDERKVKQKTSISVGFKHASFIAELMRGLCHKIAIIDTPDDSEIKNFFETVCFNRNLNLRYFLRRKDALLWLLA